MKRGDGKQRIANALMSLSAGKPIDEVPISDLIQKAGVSRTTFYYHFESTRQVLEWMMDDFMEHYFVTSSIPPGVNISELDATTQMEMERELCHFVAGTKNEIQFFLREDNYWVFFQRFFHRYQEICKLVHFVQIFPDGHSESLKQGMFYDYYVHMFCHQLFALLECWADRDFSETEDDFIRFFTMLSAAQITMQRKA